ncbi:hypothetical protein [Aquiflexum sp.]
MQNYIAWRLLRQSIDFLNSLDFLTEEDKEGIFYGNAARFLKLEEYQEQ